MLRPKDDTGEDEGRYIVAEKPWAARELSPGVTAYRFHPGGKDGPNGEVLAGEIGGQVWSELFLIGDAADGFQMMIPDIRMPANQLWPLHWHDCWTVVLMIEGRCVVGDWVMGPGDVFIAEPSVEYGPLLVGPQGCRLFEIFAQAHLSAGGYAPEYRDHPTLQGGEFAFAERSALNRRNEGRQMLPCEAASGIARSRLSPGARWELGDASDPQRSVMQDTRLAAGETLAAHTYADWHVLMVLAGGLRLGDATVEADEMIVAGPGRKVERITAGPQGAQILELARTAAGAERRRLR